MKIAITANHDKSEVLGFLPDVFDWLRQQRVQFSVEADLAHHLDLAEDSYEYVEPGDFHKYADMVISFGGDGTILSTVRKVGASGLPILGVKMGGMGFLAELMPDELFTALPKILQGQYELVERMVLAAEIEQQENSHFFALNDFVVDKGGGSRMIRLKTFIDNEFLNTYIADGLIISTPTGSTAYSLAAGGPIMLPSMDAIIISPISPHTLGARPVVIPGDKVVRIKLESSTQQVNLSGDGQVAMELNPGNQAIIKRAEHRIRLVTFGHRSFYDVLRSKLNWGEDVRETDGT